MGTKDLIPITERSPEERLRIVTKGGSARSDAKRYANLRKASVNARCKNCKASCILKEENIEKNKITRCVVPDARAKSIWYNQPVMSEELLDKLDSETLVKLKDICESPKDLKMLHDAIMNKKKVDYPKVQRVEQTNLNVDYKDFREAYKQYYKKRGIIIEEDNP